LSAVIRDNVAMWTEPVNENYEDEDENGKISLVTKITATATTDAVDLHRAAVAMTTSPRSHRKDSSVVEIDLLHQGYLVHQAKTAHKTMTDE